MSRRHEKSQRTAQEETQFLTVVFKLLIADDLLGPLFRKLAQDRAFCQGLKSGILAFAVQQAGTSVLFEVVLERKLPLAHFSSPTGTTLEFL